MWKIFKPVLNFNSSNPGLANLKKLQMKTTKIARF